MQGYELIPQDLLFMRDARPMEASDAGLGANWPRPDQLWSAIIHAFRRQWPDRQPWEGPAHTKREGKRPDGKTDNPHSSDRFGALRTVGPFPKKGGELYFPCPADLAMKMVESPRGETDLPAPLKYAFLPKVKGKVRNPRWFSSTHYRQYLNGETVMLPEKEPELYDAHRSIGIALSPETGTTIDGKLYSAEHLRLRRDVSLAFEASCDQKPKGGGEPVNVFKELDLPVRIIIGGNQGIATLKTADAVISPACGTLSSRLLRWTLLTPAVFKAGWLPGWCADTRKVPESEKQPLGTVMFKDFSFATLVAARVEKPVAFSGWDLQTGPKPTLLAVPAGSCYVFDCGTSENARKLADFLTFKPCSDLYGEKGYGIGVCSSLNIDSNR